MKPQLICTLGSRGKRSGERRLPPANGQAVALDDEAAPETAITTEQNLPSLHPPGQHIRCRIVYSAPTAGQDQLREKSCPHRPNPRSPLRQPAPPLQDKYDLFYSHHPKQPSKPPPLNCELVQRSIKAYKERMQREAAALDGMGSARRQESQAAQSEECEATALSDNGMPREDPSEQQEATP